MTAATYWSDVEPIFQKHCVGCHTENGEGPFPLDEYESARFNAATVLFMAQTRMMPPCESIDGDCGLSDEEIATLAEWVTSGAPEGVSPADAAP